MLTLRDLYVIVRNLPDDNALTRSQLSAEERAWGYGTREAALIEFTAQTADGVRGLLWQNSKDGAKGINAPKLTRRPADQAQAKALTRAEIDDFDRWYAQRFDRN